MESNFEFLNKYWPDLAEIGKVAESYLYSDPNACIYKIGVLSESILHKMFEYESIELSENDTQYLMIGTLRREGLIPNNIDNILYMIRKARNKAVHSQLDSLEEAKTLLSLCYKLSCWFMTVYGDWDFQPSSFMLPEEIQKDQTELEQIEAEYENKMAELAEQSSDNQVIETATSDISHEERQELAEKTSQQIELNNEEEAYITEEKVRMEINSLPVVSFAIQQNKVKIIESITISNQLSSPLEKLVIKITSNPGLCEDYQIGIDYLQENSTVNLKRIELNLDPVFLLGVTEKINGLLKIELECEGTTLTTELVDITVLAYDEWQGISLYPDLVCSFITPNHPAIAQIMTRAAYYLGKWTKIPALDGYQSHDKNRVLQQVASIYAALQELEIVYCQAPASFEPLGQRVRLCDAIVSQRLGNCLDLSLLYASCLEAIGINPILIFKTNHVFVGAWLDDINFSDSVLDDPSLVTKRWANGVNDIAVVETTLVTKGNNTDFDKAFEFAKTEITTESNFECVVDVKCSRVKKITPIPLRIESSEGWKIEDNTPKETVVTSAPSYISEIEFNRNDSDKQLSKKEQWERKLLDLGMRNSLINMHLTKKVIPILTTSLDRLEDRLSDGENYLLYPKPVEWKNSESKDDFESFSNLGDVSKFINNEFDQGRIHSSLTEGELFKSMKDLSRLAKTSLEENGANTLYIALGLLKWCEKASSPHYAPLILLPIDLVKKSSAQTYAISLRDEEAQFNITILEKLKQDFGIEIPGLEELPEDDHGLDIRRILTLIRHGIMNQSYWDVLESAYLGVFSFSQFVLWNDIHSRSDDLEKNKIVKSLINQQLCWDAKEMHTENVIDDYQDLYPPVSLDASQLYAVQEANKGISFVLHGPPGTGKSQTITAMIANALAHGKKVLFVAEKRAALDVVEKRLKEIGLDPFCLELHSNKAKKKDVLEQLRLVTELKAKHQNLAYDRKIRNIKILKSQLDKYAEELHHKQDGETSIFESINNYEKYVDAPDLKFVNFKSGEFLGENVLEEQTLIIERLIAAGRQVGHPKNHPLRFVTRSSISQRIQEDTEIKLEHFEGALEKLNEASLKLSELIDYKLSGTFRSIEELGEVAVRLTEWEDVPVVNARVKYPIKYYEGMIDLANKCITKDYLYKSISTIWNDSVFESNVSEYLSQISESKSKNAFERIKDVDQVLKEVNGYGRKTFISAMDLLNNDEFSHLTNIEAEAKMRVISDLNLAALKVNSYNQNALNRVKRKDQVSSIDNYVVKKTEAYQRVLKKFDLSLHAFAKEIQYPVKESFDDCEWIVKVAEELKKWIDVPRGWAKVENPNLYFEDVAEVCDLQLDEKRLYSILMTHWDEGILSYDGNDMMTKFTQAQSVGIFGRRKSVNGVIAMISSLYKGALTKNNMVNELNDLIKYQTVAAEAKTRLMKICDDLGFLYNGKDSDWEYIKSFAQSMITKAHDTDEALGTNTYRIRFGGIKDLNNEIEELINIYPALIIAKNDFYNVLSLDETSEYDYYFEKDNSVCEEILAIGNDINNWFAWNDIKDKAIHNNLDLAVKVIGNPNSEYVFMDIDSLDNSLQDIQQYLILDKEISESFNQFKPGFEQLYTGKDTNWEEVIDFANKLKKKTCEFDCVLELKRYRISSGGTKGIRESYDRFSTELENYNQLKADFYNFLEISDDKNANQNWYEVVKDRCKALHDNMDILRNWITWNSVCREAENYNLGFLINSYYYGLSHDEVLSAYKKAFYKNQASVLIDRSPLLNEFMGSQFEATIQQFKNYDEELLQLNREYTFNKLLFNVPSFTEEATRNSEISILQRAIRSHGRGNTIRRLFERIPNILTKLAPCMLMSPISVAQYLDPKRSPFDLVIFDEASQIQTCRAVGALARGENAIIVGDPRQMPPTTFFQVNSYDEDNEDIEDLESILDDCLAINMPKTYLQWHYRSNHESLIAFSNNQFYENKLLTFPSVNDRISKVSLIPVKGVFERGRKRTNPIEAQAVVDEIVRRSKDPELSKYSMGVVTFNIAQSNLIDDLIGEKCSKDKQFDKWVNQEKEPLFIKNLENVQGDERDVILFSICYGPDEQGKVSMNFGPLNRQGGQRRLNVAVSRAREEMVVFSSLTPDRINLSKTSAEGVAALKEFLIYAGTARLTQGVFDINRDKYNADGITNQLSALLKEYGYECDKLVGHSEYRIDIGVINPYNKDEYLAGILLDGPNYQIANTTRDREVSQINVLKSLKWDVYRIWSVDWWNDQELQLKKLVRYLDKLKEKKKPKDSDFENNSSSQNLASNKSVDLKGHTEKAEIQTLENNAPREKSSAMKTVTYEPVISDKTNSSNSEEKGLEQSATVQSSTVLNKPDEVNKSIVPRERNSNKSQEKQSVHSAPVHNDTSSKEYDEVRQQLSNIGIPDDIIQAIVRANYTLDEIRNANPERMSVITHLNKAEVVRTIEKVKELYELQNRKGTVQTKRKSSVNKPDIVNVLQQERYICYDNRAQSDSIWVLYEDSIDRKENLKSIVDTYQFAYSLEKRGSKITGNRKAWRIVTKKVK